MIRSSFELVFMGNGHLMDGFTHLGDQWPSWMVDGDYWSVFVFILVYVMNGGALG